MKDSRFYAQVALLIRVIPFVAEEKCFALKGGTAINMFLWDMPRLSVDIDLCYLPLIGRKESLREIASALKRIAQKIERSLAGAKVFLRTVSEANTETSFTVELNNSLIKCEVNFVLRGSVYPSVHSELCLAAQREFGAYAEIEALSLADLYGGKLCAALDRQHPRDLFDVKLLFANKGLTPEILNAFVIYLASHPRPMNELLNPTFKDISKVFEDEFADMPRNKVALEELVVVRRELVTQINSQLTKEQKHFLISMKEGEPAWSVLGILGIENLPGLNWKLINIRRMPKEKRVLGLKKLKDLLHEN